MLEVLAVIATLIVVGSAIGLRLLPGWKYRGKGNLKPPQVVP